MFVVSKCLNALTTSESVIATELLEKEFDGEWKVNEKSFIKSIVDAGSDWKELSLVLMRKSYSKWLKWIQDPVVSIASDNKGKKSSRRSDNQGMQSSVEDFYADYVVKQLYSRTKNMMNPREAIAEVAKTIGDSRGLFLLADIASSEKLPELHKGLVLRCVDSPGKLSKQTILTAIKPWLNEVPKKSLVDMLETTLEKEFSSEFYDHLCEISPAHKDELERVIKAAAKVNADAIPYLMKAKISKAR